MLAKGGILLAICAARCIAQNPTGAAMPRWDWTNPAQKMHGVALGNFIMLERWMSWDWWGQTCGNQSIVDEWGWMQAIGNDVQATAYLTDHWNTWVTEEHIKNISAAGFNHLRIPIPFWALIPKIEGQPYAFQAGQMDQLTRILGLAEQYGLYALLDLHGLPGSQNGQENSGHEGLNGFYNADNQNYADQTIDALLSYIENSTYRNIISGFEACNEPVYYSDAQFTTLIQYYERTYAKVIAMADPVPMFFHPGSANSNPLGSMTPFIAGKNSSLLVFTIHPYIGRGQSIDGTAASESALTQQLCSVTESYADYGVPVAITEWSLTSPIVNDTNWELEWFGGQAKAYSNSGGGVFWSMFVNGSTSYNGTETINFYQYSMLDLFARGSIPAIGLNQTTEQYLDSLPSVCTTEQATETWANPIPTIATATTTGSVTRKRSARWI